MSLVPLLLVLLLTPSLSSPALRQNRAPCGGFCNFRLCAFDFEGDTTFLPKSPTPSTIISPPRRAAFPYICRNNTNIGQVLSRAEALVRVNNKYVPISKWRPKGLNAPFSKTLIRPAQIAFTQWSGIARGVTMGNQWDYLHDRCVVLPVRRYQVVNPKNGAATPLTVGKMDRRSSCVAFRTEAARILVQLIWDSGDDFDLYVVEPDGDVLYYSNTETEAGRITEDITSSCSSKLKFGRESILYEPGGPIEKGTYAVRVQHFSNCDQVASAWRLTVTVDGEIRLRDSGVSTIGGDEIISLGRFDFL